MSRKKNILITGQPGIGKTTFIKKLAEELKVLHPSGFYTTEEVTERCDILSLKNPSWADRIRGLHEQRATRRDLIAF